MINRQAWTGHLRDTRVGLVTPVVRSARTKGDQGHGKGVGKREGEGEVGRSSRKLDPESLRAGPKDGFKNRCIIVSRCYGAPSGLGPNDWRRSSCLIVIVIVFAFPVAGN